MVCVLLVDMHMKMRESVALFANRSISCNHRPPELGTAVRPSQGQISLDMTSMQNLTTLQQSTASITSNPSAAIQVFNLPEIVEEILDELHTDEVLAIARTNCTISDAIKCANLQRKLGFLHSKTLTTTHYTQSA
jgi:hypothetical protein